MAEDVNLPKLFKRGLEGSGLLLVAAAVAVDIEEATPKFLLECLSEIILNVEADNLLALGDEISR